MEVKHLSHSAIMCYLSCPAHYVFRYICGIRIPPRAIMIQGRAVHGAIAEGFNQKLASSVDPKIDDMLSVFDFQFGKDIKEIELTKKDEPADKLKDQGVKLLKMYRTDRMPQLKPAHVEKKFELELTAGKGEFNFTGFIDLIDSTGNVIDHKVVGKTPNKIEIDNDQQLTAYSIGTKKITNKSPKDLQLDFLVRTSIPKIISIKTKRNAEDINRFLINIGYVKAAIEADLFYCIHHSSSWVCRNDYCAYQERGYHAELYKLGVNKFIDKYGKFDETE